MDGENKGKPYEQIDDLGGFSHIFGNTHIYIYIFFFSKIMYQANHQCHCSSETKKNLESCHSIACLDMCQGLNSHHFHIIGDGHQPNSRGLYTHYKDSVIKGGMTIPNIATFDHGTYSHFQKKSLHSIHFFQVYIVSQSYGWWLKSG